MSLALIPAPGALVARWVHFYMLDAFTILAFDMLRAEALIEQAGEAGADA